MREERQHRVLRPQFVALLVRPHADTALTLAASLCRQVIGTITDRGRTFRCGGTHQSTSDSTSGNGVRRGGAAGRWTAAPLRTTGCLKESESTTLPTASHFGPLQFASDLCSVDTLASCEVGSPASTRAANCLTPVVWLGKYHSP